MKENWEIHWKDYYSILQIHPLAEPEVVKAAYDKLARKYHPDKNPNVSSEKMKDLNEAYEIINDPVKRARYYLIYCQKVNSNTIIPQYNPNSTSSTYRPETKVTPTKPSKIEHLERWCAKCQKTTNMKIVFVNKKPAFSACPICQTYWELKQGVYTSPNQPRHKSNQTDLTPDEKIRLEKIRNKFNKHYK
jgi:curved DNA-binding protein CbpA